MLVRLRAPHPVSDGRRSIAHGFFVQLPITFRDMRLQHRHRLTFENAGEYKATHTKKRFASVITP